MPSNIKALLFFPLRSFVNRGPDITASKSLAVLSRPFPEKGYHATKSPTSAANTFTNIVIDALSANPPGSVTLTLNVYEPSAAGAVQEGFSTLLLSNAPPLAVQV